MVHDNNDDQSYYSYYSEGSMNLAKRQNKQLSMVAYVPMENSGSGHRRSSMASLHEDDETTVASDMLLNTADAAASSKSSSSLLKPSLKTMPKYSSPPSTPKHAASSPKEAPTTPEKRSARASRALAYASKGWKRNHLSVNTTPSDNTTALEELDSPKENERPMMQAKTTSRKSPSSYHSRRLAAASRQFT